MYRKLRFLDLWSWQVTTGFESSLSMVYSSEGILDFKRHNHNQQPD